MTKKNIICAVFGLVLGIGLGAYKDYKKNHEDVKTGADITEDDTEYDDIDDVKEYEVHEESTEPSPTDYRKYSDIASQYKQPERKEQTVRNKPVIISPDEYGEEEYYTQIEFVYCADGVLFNEDQEVVEDYKKYIGDALQHFGEYEDDSVYVRNDKLKSYFAVLKDFRKSTDFPKRYAH